MTEAITHTILEQLDTLVVTVNKSGSVEYVSPSAKRMLGYDVDSLLGNGWWNLTRHEADSFLHKAAIIRLFNDPENFRTLSFERELLTREGRQKWILWNISVSDDELIVGVGQDITAQKKIEERLREQTNEMLRQKKTIEEKNKDITDSILYAKKIQTAILPDEDGLQKYFPESFVLYKPKDIVSGDFYWFHRKNNKTFVAVADCTGHGVPGAIMSVIGNNLLRDAVLKHGQEDPAQILYTMDQELEELLNKNGAPVTQDGMDIAVAVFNSDDNIVEFSGAFRPLVLVRNGSVSELSGDRYPIGFYEDVRKSFKTQSLQLLKDDRIYLFSDGYCDQFGGERGKKLNRKRFFEFLIDSAEMTMQEQGAYLDYSLNNWKQDEVQTDDVLMIGIQI